MSFLRNYLDANPSAGTIESVLELLLAAGGGAYYGDTTQRTVAAKAIQVLTDAKFHTLTGNLTGLANTTSGSAVTVPAGTILYGTFTVIKLHSGGVIVY